MPNYNLMSGETSDNDAPTIGRMHATICVAFSQEQGNHHHQKSNVEKRQ
jgi:hypothetical protein